MYLPICHSIHLFVSWFNSYLPILLLICVLYLLFTCPIHLSVLSFIFLSSCLLILLASSPPISTTYLNYVSTLLSFYLPICHLIYLFLTYFANLCVIYPFIYILVSFTYFINYSSPISTIYLFYLQINLSTLLFTYLSLNLLRSYLFC